MPHMLCSAPSEEETSRYLVLDREHVERMLAEEFQNRWALTAEFGVQWHVDGVGAMLGGEASARRLSEVGRDGRHASGAACMSP